MHVIKQNNNKGMRVLVTFSHPRLGNYSTYAINTQLLSTCGFSFLNCWRTTSSSNGEDILPVCFQFLNHSALTFPSVVLGSLQRSNFFLNSSQESFSFPTSATALPDNFTSISELLRNCISSSLFWTGSVSELLDLCFVEMPCCSFYQSVMCFTMPQRYLAQQIKQNSSNVRQQEVPESLNYTWVKYNERVSFVVDLYYYSNTFFFLGVMKVSYIIQYHTPSYTRARSQPSASGQSTVQQHPSVHNGIGINRNSTSTGNILWFGEQITTVEIL